MSSIARWIRHNQGMFVAAQICAVLLVWTYGCQSKVASLIDPERKVAAAELNIEVDQLVAELNAQLDILIKKAELKKQELFRQDEIKRKLFEFAALTAQSGTFNPVGLIALAGSLLGVGAVVDNRIKDKVIKNRPLAES